MIEVELDDGRIIEVNTDDEAVARETVRKFLAGEGAAPRESVGGGIVDKLTQGITFGYGDEITAHEAALLGRTPQGGWFDYSKPYDERYQAALEAEKGQQARFSEQNPKTALAAELAGAVGTGALLPMVAPFRAVQGAGRLAQGAAAGGNAALTGAAYGGVYASGDAEAGNRLSEAAAGAGMGALMGPAAHAVGAGLVKGGTYASKLAQYLRADPRARATSRVYEAVAPQSARQMGDMGPEAMAIDVLGTRGTAMGRQAANINPEAREILETALQGRKAGQNVRIVSDIEDAVGLTGAAKGAADLAEDARHAAQPAISRAYQQAADAGFDLPREPFRPIIVESKAGKRAYEQAADVAKDFAIKDGRDVVSELDRLNATKIILDGKASAAYRAGDRAQGERYAGLAKTLRQTIDDTLSSDAYAGARDLARQSFKRQEAFMRGAELARPKIPRDLPRKVAGIQDNRDAIAQGYAAELSERLLNRGSTEHALNMMSTPMAQRSAAAALPANAQEALARSLARERAFNKPAREVLGNSTTARQLAEMGAGGGIGAMLTGDFTGGVGGAAAGLARRGASSFLRRKLATQPQIEAAPEIARLLTAGTIPTHRPIPPALMERALTQNKDALIRALIAGSVASQ